MSKEQKSNVTTKSKEVFDRSNGFYCYRFYYETMENIAEDFGNDAAIDYVRAVSRYALFEEEPEIKGVLRYCWAMTREKIDGHQNARAKGFRENVELNNRIINYKEENPKATYREIAEALNCSKSKVGNVLKEYIPSSTTYTIPNTDPNTNTTPNPTMDVDERGQDGQRGQNSDIHIHSDSFAGKEDSAYAEPVNRKQLSDLSIQHLNEFIKMYEDGNGWRAIEDWFGFSTGYMNNYRIREAKELRAQHYEQMNSSFKGKNEVEDLPFN